MVKSSPWGNAPDLGMQYVWLAQCLCPQRHAILASATEVDDEAEARGLETSLREQVAEMLRSRTINPWCGLCGAPVETWSYEVARTRWRTMDDALPPLREEERRNAATAALFGKHGDKPP